MQIPPFFFHSCVLFLLSEDVHPDSAEQHDDNQADSGNCSLPIERTAVRSIYGGQLSREVPDAVRRVIDDVHGLVLERRAVRLRRARCELRERNRANTEQDADENKREREVHAVLH